MTEQARFHFGYVCGDTGLIDEQAEHQWFIENCCSITDLKKNWKTVCDKLNEVNDENEELKERVKQLQLNNTQQLQNKKNYLHKKPQVWFTQSHILTDKQANEIAEAINQSLKERRIKKMTEKREITINLEDDFGRATTKITTKLSPPTLMDKILEVLEE